MEKKKINSKVMILFFLLLRFSFPAANSVFASRESVSVQQEQAMVKSDEFMLADKGQPAATIVISPSPTVAAAFATKELQDHILKITGAVLPIVTDETNIQGPRILIGESKATREYGLKGADFQHQEHLIQFKDQTLILLGRDKETAFNPAVPLDLSSVPLPGWFDDRDTLNAVYDLLELYCGVRWYHPTEVGTVCPENSTLVIKRNDLRRKSDMISNRGYFHAGYCLPGFRNVLPANEIDLWRLRMRMGGHPVQIDHSLYDYYDRFYDKKNHPESYHPEWFAKGYEGLSQPPQPCYTNPELIKQVAQDARDYFDGKYLSKRWPISALPPGSDFFPIVPMDDMRWCQCDRCKAEFDMNSKTVSTSNVFSSGEASNYIWGFINKVAKEVKKTHPDKYVAGIAYQQFAAYPTKVKLESNVAVEFCLWNIRGWHIPKLKTVEMQTIDDWTTKGEKRPMFIWVYYMNPMANALDNWKPFPYYFGHEAIRQMKMFHDRNIIGMWMAHSSEMGYSHLYDFPDLYLATRLGENASLDGNQMLDEFFTLYYGAAADPMKQLYQSLEDAYTNPANYPAAWLNQPNIRVTEDIAWGRLGTPERMEQWAKLISSAQALAQTPMEKTRIDYFVQGIWKPMTQGASDHALIAERKKQPLHIRVPKASAMYDGDPSKVDWSKAADIGILSAHTGILNPIGREIQIEIIHDEQWLYIQSLEKVDPSLLDYSGLNDINTDPLFFDSFVFMTSTDQNAFRQINIIGANKKERTDFTGSGETSDSWKKSWKGISDKSLPDHWRVWIAIPLSDVIPGGAGSGTEFYGNFYRYCIAPTGGRLVWQPSFEDGYAPRNVKKMGKISLE